MLSKSLKRIVIIGSAGVGKTTLLNNIKRRAGLKVIPEIAREICNKLGYKNIYEIKDKKQKALKWYDSSAQSNSKESTKEKLAQKNRALKWYAKKADAFSKEINSSKKKALKWYERNSK